MDIKTAEQVAENPAGAEDSVLREAYAYLERNVNNKQSSEDLRERISIARNKIFNWAYAKAVKAHPIQTTKQKKSRI